MHAIDRILCRACFSFRKIIIFNRLLVANFCTSFMIIRYRDAIIMWLSRLSDKNAKNLFFSGGVQIGKIRRAARLINDIFLCNANPHCRNVIANRKHDA